MCLVIRSVLIELGSIGVVTFCGRCAQRFVLGMWFMATGRFGAVNMGTHASKVPTHRYAVLLMLPACVRSRRSFWRAKVFIARGPESRALESVRTQRARRLRMRGASDKTSPATANLEPGRRAV